MLSIQGHGGSMRQDKLGCCTASCMECGAKGLVVVGWCMQCAVHKGSSDFKPWHSLECWGLACWLEAYLVVVASPPCPPNDEGRDCRQQAQHNQGADDDDRNDAALADVLAIQAPVGKLLGAGGGGGVGRLDGQQRGVEAASLGSNLGLPGMQGFR